MRPSKVDNSSGCKSRSGKVGQPIINLGYGDAKQLQLAPLLGSDKIMGLGIATQKPDNTTGINTRLYINDPVATGLRSWKELH